MISFRRMAWTACLFLLLSQSAAFAHDLWLVPEANLAVDQSTKIRVTSGMEFPKGEQAPDTAKFAKREALGPDGVRVALEAAGKDGTSGLMSYTPAKTGIHIVTVQTTPKLINLDADAFNDYLVSDGMPHIYKLRHRENSLDQPAKERYSKSPKLILKIGDGPGDATKPVGLPLEIVPLKDPFQLKTDDTLKVRVLFQGKPLADANLGWTYPDMGQAPLGTVRTNAQGEALIPIAQTGLFSIRLTHMTRPKTAEYEWESFWTTLTFRIGG